MIKFSSALEIGKFGFYVFVPLGVLYFVNTDYYQDTFIRPYTLFPSAGKTLADRPDFPVREDKDEQEKWEQQMRDSVSIRKRAKEIYAEMVQKGS